MQKSGKPTAKLPGLSSRAQYRSSSEATFKTDGFEISEFQTSRDIVAATERAMLKLNQTRGHGILDREYRQSIDILKKKSMKNIVGNKDFRVKTKTSEISLSAIDPQTLSSMILKIRKKSSPEMNILQSNASKEMPIDKRVVSFFNVIRDPQIIKLADDSLETAVQLSLSKKEMDLFYSNLREIVSALSKVFDLASNTLQDLSQEHIQILMEICKKKLDFIDRSYLQALNIHKSLGDMDKKSHEQHEIVQEDNWGGSSLNVDVRYFMGTLNSQTEYFRLKMNLFKWKDTEDLDKVTNLYNRYIDHKTILQVKSQQKDFSKYVDTMQLMLEDWIKMITVVDLDLKKRGMEIERLESRIKDLENIIANDRANVVEMQQLLRSQIGPDRTQIRNEFEANFADIKENMKKNVDNAYKERDSYKEKYDQLQIKVDRYEMEKLKRESNKQSKETQAIFQIGAAKETQRLLSDTLNKPELAINNGDSGCKDWLCSMMNYLIVARLNFENEIGYKHMEPKSMKDFIVETLLIRFGSGQAAEHMLRDFIASLKRYSIEGERFKLFAKFLGIEDILSNDLVKKRKGNRYEEFLTRYYYTSHLAIRDYLEFCLLAKGFDFNEDAALKPLLGFCISKKATPLMLRTDVAKKIYLLFILNREGKFRIQAELLEDDFENILKEDLYERLHDRGKEIRATNFKNEEFFISYDYLAKVLLERRLAHFVGYIQNFHSALTMSTAAMGENNILYNDVAYSCSQLQHVGQQIPEYIIGQIFREIADTPQLQAYSLEKIIQSVVHTLVLLNNDQYKTDYIRLAVTKEAHDERNQMITAAEHLMNVRLRANSVKKEGNRFQAMIDGLTKWREKYMVPNHETMTDGVKQHQLLDRWKIDNISSLACLQESYERTRSRINEAERSDETIAMLHASINNFLTSIPERLIYRPAYEDLKEHEHMDFSYKIDKVWAELRKAISVSFFHNAH